MPRYDYRCVTCGHEVEITHGVDGAGPTTCDVCGGAMRKALSTPAIHFKGSGWAKMDSRGSSGGKRPGVEASESGAKGEPGSPSESLRPADAPTPTPRSSDGTSGGTGGAKAADQRS